MLQLTRWILDTKSELHSLPGINYCWCLTTGVGVCVADETDAGVTIDGCTLVLTVNADLSDALINTEIKSKCKLIHIVTRSHINCIYM